VILVMVLWHVNLFRGDKFAEGWAPIAEAVLDYGALSWGFYRSQEGRLDFMQTATVRTKADFDRYWYSETVAERRVELAGYYQVPIVPAYFEVVGEGKTVTLAPVEPS
jgi:hypothetical protein